MAVVRALDPGEGAGGGRLMGESADILPGLETALAEMERDTERGCDSPHFTAELVAARSPERYELAARFLFSERMSRRAICRLLRMSMNTLAAIEAREMRLHPERVEELRVEERIEAAQLRRMCREEIRARLFDEKALADIPLGELTKLMKSLDAPEAAEPGAKPDRRAEEPNEYVEAVSEWGDGFRGAENPAGENAERGEGSCGGEAGPDEPQDGGAS